MTTWQEELTQTKKDVIERLTNTSNQTSSSIPKMTCPLCNGSGWVLYQDENGYDYAKECDCGIRQREIQESKLRFASIPVNYKDVKLNDITTRFYQKPESKNTFKVIADFIKDYLKTLDDHAKAGKGIYFWSKTKGSGKTMLATALANELINKHGRYVKFATSLDILDEIRATYDDHSEDRESNLLNDLVSAEFLVIDDFGTERASDWAGEKFYQIVNKRYVNKKVTFYTSNYDLKTLKYDDRISSRIRERSFLVHFPEESVREVKARQENVIG